MKIIFHGNDNLILVKGVYNNATSAYVNNATVNVTLKDANGTDLTGQTWPLVLSYIAASNGDYQGTIDDAANTEGLTSGSAIITISAGGFTASITADVEFQDREADTAEEAASIDFIEAALSPREMHGDEGIIKERSIDELIKAHSYNAANQAAATVPPYGMYLSKLRKPGAA